MIIIIGNQKGGAGKSTLAVLLANFLTLVKHRHLTLVDMDYQQSVFQKYERAKILENAEPYEVIPSTAQSFQVLHDGLRKIADSIVLIDLPGKLDDDRLIPVLYAAGLVICPFAYDEFSFNSTVQFALVLKKINPKTGLVFIPNRVKANAKPETIEEVNGQLSLLGRITAPLPDRVEFSRITTFQTPAGLMPVVSPALEQIYTDHISAK